jgi:DNA-binding CsgD family transcriptional regulator
VCDHAARAGDGLMRRVAELTLPAIAVCEHGNIIRANEIHEVLRGASVEKIIGMHLRDVVGERFCTPTLALVHRVLGDGRPRTALVMWRGHWIRVRYTCVTFNDCSSCLIHVDPWREPVWDSVPPDEEPPEEFKVHDLGDLSVLSAREAEVLWMIGQGMSLPKVAKVMTRSTKTIESHVRAIGGKIKVRGRFGMGLFAKERGLCNMTQEQIGRVFGERPSSRVAEFE